MYVPAYRATTLMRWLFFVLLTGMAGCNGINLRTAEETRTLNTSANMTGGLWVRTSNGSVSVEADPSRGDVEIVATVRAAAATEAEAQSRLSEVQVIVAKTTNQSLDISVQFPTERRSNEGCSFTIKVPSANGLNIDTGNGGVTLKSLSGLATVRTSNGTVTILDHSGDIDAETSNGAMQIERCTGNIRIDTSNGKIVIIDSQGTVDAGTSNGSVKLVAKSVPGDIRIDTSNGGVDLSLPRLMTGTIRGSTSNGRLICPTLVSTQPIRLTDNTRKGGDFEIVIGSGGAVCIAETSNGNITLDLHD